MLFSLRASILSSGESFAVASKKGRAGVLVCLRCCGYRDLFLCLLPKFYLHLAVPKMHFYGLGTWVAQSIEVTSSVVCVGVLRRLVVTTFPLLSVPLAERNQVVVSSSL